MSVWPAAPDRSGSQSIHGQFPRWYISSSWARSLTVSAGEVVLVAGPSGCGKSTLIRAINGLIPHAYSGDLTGTVRVDGQSTSELKLRDLARTIGTVLQDPAKQLAARHAARILHFVFTLHFTYGLRRKFGS